jgi:hypothetical protein
MVLSKGKPCGLTDLQPFGGKSQEPRLKWKTAQKKLKKYTIFMLKTALA